MHKRRTSIIVILLLLSFIIPSHSAESKRPKIGLVLSGGGAKGIAHIAVIKIIEDLGIPIDYITGTSMGSVIGSLYASGYNSTQIDSIAKNLNWSALFSDELSRDKISIEEKFDSERYILEMGIDNYHLALPQGLISGQKLSQKLSTLLLPVHEITDFSKLPIPFKCIATDIESGKAVVLDHGNLAISVRASMAIPSIFNPIEIDNKLLVDGGIIRNFPVIDAKNMGADIIIGVDVGSHLFKKEELKSLLNIMQQTVAFRGNAATKQQRELCDILITPDIQGINASSFEDADAILMRGKVAAMKVYPALKALADSIKQFNEPNIKTEQPLISNEFLITDIVIRGNKQLPSKVILQKLYIKKNEIATTQQIIDNVEKIFSTKFFKNVYFQIVPNMLNGNTLILEVVEQNVNRVKLGIHYDNDLKSALLLNYTTRNFFFNGSKFTIDARLSENPAIRASYFYYTGLKPDIGLGLITEYTRLNLAEYQFGNQRVGTSDYNIFLIDGRLNTIILPSLSLSGGLTFQSSEMGVEGMIKEEQFGLPCNLPLRVGISEKINLYSFYSILNFDNLNSKFFTKKGSKITFRIEYVPNIGKSDLKLKFFINPDDNNPIEISEDAGYKNFLHFTGKIQHSIPFSKSLSSTAQIRAGFTNRSDIPIYYNFMLGGISGERKNIIPFMGARLLNYSGTNFLSSLLSLQYEPLHDKFIVFTGNIGYITNDFYDFFNINITDENFIYGYGLTFGMNSIIGPLGVTFMTRDNLKNMLTYMTVGYPF